MTSPHLRSARGQSVGRRRCSWTLLAGSVVVVLVAGVVTAAGMHPPGPGVVAPVAAPPSGGVVTVAAPLGPLAPAEFAPGACVALGPTAGDRHRTVFLDAGHGDFDPGSSGVTASGTSIDEKDLTLPVALGTAELLRAQGYRVALSRTTDTVGIPLSPADLTGNTLSTAGDHAELLARAHCANLAGADVLVSIHFAAFTDSSARGATTLYDPARSFAAANTQLATLLQHEIEHEFTDGGWQVPDRGAVDDTETGGGEQTTQGATYGHLGLLGPAAPGYLDEPSAMPGALVEPLFISNPDEATLAASPAGQQAIAQALAAGLEQFLQQP